MKFLKLGLFLSFLTPLVLINSELKPLEPQRVQYEILEMEMIELNDMMLYNDHLVMNNVDDPVNYTMHFTYEQALEMQTEHQVLPTKDELIAFLDNAGFNTEGPYGFILDSYYDLNLQYPGIEDPILGNYQAGEKVGFWFKENEQGENYLSIEKDDLNYKVGHTSRLTKMSVRYIRKP